MEEGGEQLHRGPQMMGQASDKEEEESLDRPTSCFSLRRSNMFSISMRACWIILTTNYIQWK